MYKHANQILLDKCSNKIVKSCFYNTDTIKIYFTDKSELSIYSGLDYMQKYRSRLDVSLKTIEKE